VITDRQMTTREGLELVKFEIEKLRLDRKNLLHALEEVADYIDADMPLMARGICEQALEAVKESDW
jgi:hypothetical protein